MEIGISFERSLSLDHILHDSKPLVFRKRSFVSGPCFLLDRRKLTKPFHRIRCSSVETSLRARPKPIRPPNNPIVENEASVEDVQVQNSGSSLCSQIENLVSCKRYPDALELFDVLMSHRGVAVEAWAYDALVTACIALKSVRGVKRVCEHMRESRFELDQYTRNRVLLMHVKCGMMIDARQLFKDMPDRNIISWNTIIEGLVDSGDCFEALNLFRLMWCEFSDAGSRTFVTLMRACARTGFVFVGRQLHSCVIKLGISNVVFVSCALIDMYGKCGCIHDGRTVFDSMPEKTTVGWNTIITGYALHGYSEEALGIYYEMRDSGVEIDHFTLSMVVRICARLASVDHAKQAHAALVRQGFGSDVVANTALVDFYSKWGKIEDARHVFNSMPNKNVMSWNALIAGYGHHGRGIEAVQMFKHMVHDGMIPNHVTLLAVLSACSCCGLSDCAWEIFESMKSDYKIKPRAMHYACMVALLGREGHLDEALAFIIDAPFRPSVKMWAALLTACRAHKNFELGKLAAEKIFQLKPEKLSNYIMLLNIYNHTGQLEDAAHVLQTLKQRGMRMLPACSWIQVNKTSHVFFSGDKRHAHSKEVYQKLDDLLMDISKFGYVPEGKYFLSDVGEQKGAVLAYHSEKLAVAFGLMNTADLMPLQVVQSHRICSDCHTAVKLIAMITGREIVVRDAYRFHHFKDGSCSCGDYW